MISHPILFLSEANYDKIKPLLESSTVQLGCIFRLCVNNTIQVDLSQSDLQVNTNEYPALHIGRNLQYRYRIEGVKEIGVALSLFH